MADFAISLRVTRPGHGPTQKKGNNRMNYIMVAMFINSAGVPVFFEPRPFETLEACENSEAPSFMKKYRDSEFSSAFLCLKAADFDRERFDVATAGITQ